MSIIGLFLIVKMMCWVLLSRSNPQRVEALPVVHSYFPNVLRLFSAVVVGTCRGWQAPADCARL